MAAFLVHVVLVAAVAVASVLGDRSPEPPYRSDVTDAANFAIDFHNRMSSYGYAYKVLTILSDKAQIYPPARVKYTMTVRVGQTVCKNNPGVDLADCSLQDTADAKTMTCHFVVLAVPHSSVPSHLLLDECN